MFLFKKKKSDNKLSTNVIQQQQQQQQKSVELTHPNPPKKPLPLIDQKPRQSTPPSIIMPKPRRVLTPTRAILGRNDHEKTEVEEEEPVPDIISPILLPTLHQEQDIAIHKPVAAVPKKNSLQYVHSHSTSSSNNSSKLYESAQEYLSDEEDTRFTNMSSFSLLKKQGLDSSNIASDSSSRTATPGTKLHRVAVRSTTSSATITPNKSMPPNVILAAVATTTAADVDTATAAVAAEYLTHHDTDYDSAVVSENNTHHVNTVLKSNTMINSHPALDSNIVCDSNIGLGSSVVNTDSTISHNSGTIYNHVHYADNNVDSMNNNNANNTYSYNNDINYMNSVAKNSRRSVPAHGSTRYDKEPTAPNDTKEPRDVDDLNLSLQKQKEEQDILLYRLTKQVEMMEKQRILDREEWCRKEQELLAYRQVMISTLDETQQQLSNVLKTREEQKEKEIYYQQQLQLQQLQQLKQSQQVTTHQPQEEPAENEDDRNVVDENEDDSIESEYYGRQPVMVDPDYNERRLSRCKSEEYMRYHNSRSSSRASLHHTQYYPQHPEEERRSVSRRNSNNSNRSYRLDPSPSATIVANPMTPRGRGNRPRARSIEAAKWNENVIKMHETTDMSQTFSRKPRRSRSVGRRPQSRGSVMYYDEVVDQFDDYERYYDDPRYDEYYMAQPVQPVQPVQPSPYSYYAPFPSYAPSRQHHSTRYRQRNYDYH